MSSNIRSMKNLVTKSVGKPIDGFIMQKDLFSSNILYEHTKLSLKNLKKIIPFREAINIPKRSIKLNDSLKILHKNGKITKNSDNLSKFYSICSYKPKQLTHRKLKFPLPLITLAKNFSSEKNNTTKENNLLTNFEDDLNITSNKNNKKAKNKILMNRNSQTNLTIKFPTVCITNRNHYISVLHKRKKGSGFNSPYIKKDIININKYLLEMKEDEIERKKSFIKEKFFRTQIG